MPPRNLKTIESERQVDKSPNYKDLFYIFTKFALVNIRTLEKKGEIVGPEKVTFHSQDQKGKMLIEVAVTKKETLQE